MKNFVAAMSVVLGFAACTPEGSQLSSDAVQDVTTVDAFLALGARQLTGSEITSRVVGRTLDEGSWTWMIEGNGTHWAQADDGSWSDSGGRWELRGDEYCRNSPERPRMNCSRMYMIGNFLRMGNTSGDLAEWTVQVL